jgi:hypothetical protein
MANGEPTLRVNHEQELCRTVPARLAVLAHGHHEREASIGQERHREERILQPRGGDVVHCKVEVCAIEIRHVLLSAVILPTEAQWSLADISVAKRAVTTRRVQRVRESGLAGDPQQDCESKSRHSVNYASVHCDSCRWVLHCQ